MNAKALGWAKDVVTNIKTDVVFEYEKILIQLLVSQPGTQHDANWYQLTPCYHDDTTCCSCA